MLKVQDIELSLLKPWADNPRINDEAWGVRERLADVLIKRMINCLDCGFCMVECFPCRRFDRANKSLQIEDCIQCSKCMRLGFCMGWRHRFWRRIIVEDLCNGEREVRSQRLSI